MKLTNRQHETWRIVRNRRPIGKAFRLQWGFWNQPSIAGYAKGLNRRFTVLYEEEYATHAAAAAVAFGRPGYLHK